MKYYYEEVKLECKMDHEKVKKMQVNGWKVIRVIGYAVTLELSAK